MNNRLDNDKGFVVRQRANTVRPYKPGNGCVVGTNSRRASRLRRVPVVYKPGNGCVVGANCVRPLFPCERKSFLIGLLLCLFCLTAQTAAQTATAPATAADTAKSLDVIFMEKYGKGAADSLVAIVKNDYLICAGDPEKISRTQLFRWKSHIDSMVRDKSYPERFKSFVAATGMKAHEVRPCEPIVFYEQLDRQIAEMDNIISAQRAAKEKAHKDSMTIATELKHNKASHADILGLPTGISKNALKLILDRDKIKYKLVQDYILADSLIIDGQHVAAAFYFNANGHYNAYELETAAVKAAAIDTLVRKWADELAASYERRLGKPPTTVNRVSFHEIRQGRLSITRKWDNQFPKVIVGIATDNNLYYAKVMVNY